MGDLNKKVNRPEKWKLLKIWFERFNKNVKILEMPYFNDAFFKISGMPVERLTRLSPFTFSNDCSSYLKKWFNFSAFSSISITWCNSGVIMFKNTFWRVFCIHYMNLNKKLNLIDYSK